MAGQIRIDTDQVNAVAQTIENLNGQLKEERVEYQLGRRSGKCGDQ